MTRPRFLRLALAAVIAAAPLAAATPGSDEDCLVCHSDKDLKSAKGVSLFVDDVLYRASAHGQAGASCVDCHADLAKVKDFPHAEKLQGVDCSVCHEDEAAKIRASIHAGPHPAPNAEVEVSCKDCHGTHDIRTKEDADSPVFSINIPDTCERCHLERVQTERGADFVRTFNESVHFRVAKKSGLNLSATCATCHGAHDVRQTQDPASRVARKNIIRTCGRCHAGIEKVYLEGVHGKDYLKGSQDVPVCTDCHSEHAIQTPETLSSRVYATRIADVCARCHDDERLARQYGMLTSRLRTYSSSFHGTASGFGETRVANCASCHGFHDIRNSSDPESLIHPANLSRTCGQCHAGAGPNFAKGKIHVVSEKTESKGTYIAKTFYIVAIGGLISVFLIFIAVDLIRRARTRWTQKKSR
jgi:predicted CXXCH cytochrome family protein